MLFLGQPALHHPDDPHVAVLLGGQNLDHAVDFRDHGLTLRLAPGLQELFHPGQTRGDVLLRGHAARVEGPQRQLRTRLTDGLGGNDAHRGAHLHHLARAQVQAIALGANAEG